MDISLPHTPPASPTLSTFVPTVPTVPTLSTSKETIHSVIGTIPGWTMDLTDVTNQYLPRCQTEDKYCRRDEEYQICLDCEKAYCNFHISTYYCDICKVCTCDEHTYPDHDAFFCRLCFVNFSTLMR